MPNVAETTTIGKKDTVIGRTSKKGNIDIFNSQLPPPITLADIIELYKIKKIVQVEKNGINIINAIKVLSNNSSNNKNDGDPFFNIGNKG